VILFAVEKYLKVDTRKRMFAERRYFTEPTANRAHDEQTIAQVSRKYVPTVVSHRLEIIERFIHPYTQIKIIFIKNLYIYINLLYLYYIY